MELGDVQNTANGAPIRSAPNSENLWSTPNSETSKIKTISEAAAAAEIKHSHRGESSIPRNDDKVNSLFNTPTNDIEDFCTAVAERLEEYEQMVREISDGRFSWRNLKNWPEVEAEKVLHLLRDD